MMGTLLAVKDRVGWPWREPDITVMGARHRSAGCCSTMPTALLSRALGTLHVTATLGLGRGGVTRHWGAGGPGLEPCRPRCEAAVPRAHPAVRGQHVAVSLQLRCQQCSAAAPAPEAVLALQRLHPAPSGTASAGPSGWQVWLHPMMSRGTDCRGESGIEQPAVRAAGFMPRTLENTALSRIGPFRVEHLLSRSPLARGMFAGTLSLV